MYLYYGSNIKVVNPKIVNSKRSLDFGKGFYLTTDLEQAKKWARLITKRRGKGIATVSVFNYDSDNELKILKFATPNIKWLKFVSYHRKMLNLEEKYDVIIGSVANDRTMPVVNLYLSGQYNEKEALKRLLPQKLNDQFVFKSNKSLKCLKFKEAINCEEDI